MISQGEDVEIHALRKQGWSISAIARHVGRDRKTVRAYLNGDRQAGVRAKPDGLVDPFDVVEPYVRQRLADDPHVRATVLFREVQALPVGYDRSYQTFCRQLRHRGLRPHCEPCASSNGRAHVDIDHPPGVEIQWDWLELTGTPWGAKAYVLVGVLSHSGMFRCWFSESDDQAHLVIAIHEILQRLGGTARRWRVDRMATVIKPGTDEIQASFAPVAKHYGVGVDPCPPRHANRKGVVENAIGYLTQSWWRTARVGSPAEAQASVDRWCVEVADQRLRHRDDAGVVTVAEAAEGEPLLALPAAPFPVTVTLERVVAANGLVSVWGNRYSVPPGLVRANVEVRHRHGTDTIDICASGRVVATHRLAPAGAHRVVRLAEHTKALENVVLGGFTTDKPCARKVNRPPSDAALAIAAQLGADALNEPVVDLDIYRRLVEGDAS
jgi:transposase